MVTTYSFPTHMIQTTQPDRSRFTNNNTAVSVSVSDVYAIPKFQTDIPPASPTRPDSPTLPDPPRFKPEIPTRSSSLNPTHVSVPVFSQPQHTNDKSTPLQQRKKPAQIYNYNHNHPNPLRSNPSTENLLLKQPTDMIRLFASQRLATARVNLLSTIVNELDGHLTHSPQSQHTASRLWSTLEKLEFRCGVDGRLRAGAIEMENGFVRRGGQGFVWRGEGEVAEKRRRRAGGKRRVEKVSEPVAALRWKLAGRVERCRREMEGRAEVQLDVGDVVADMEVLRGWGFDGEGESNGVEGGLSRADDGDGSQLVELQLCLENEVSDGADKQVVVPDDPNSCRGRRRSRSRRRSVSSYWRKKAEKHPYRTPEELIEISVAWKHRYDLDIEEDGGDGDRVDDSEREQAPLDTITESPGMDEAGADDDGYSGKFDYHNSLREMAGLAINF